MKRIFALLLVVVMTAAALSACTSGNSETTSGTTEQDLTSASSAASQPTTGTSASVTPSEDPGTGTPTENPSTEIPTHFVLEELQSAPSTKKTHEMMTELPSGATLVGSDTLPPIDNQGQIGACQSESATYMQFTNAAARYLQSIGQLGDWKPADDYNSCFSPKFSYQFCGGSTGNVYNFLKDQGALTYAEDPYAKNGDASVSLIGGVLQQTTTRWPVYEGAFEKAMNFRISNFEQTFVTNNALYTVSDKKGVNMTESEAGKAMLYKIKEAIASGNAVVTGGYPSAWSDGVVTLRRPTGTIAKSGDQVITFATSVRNGGHNVTIVGYDDELEVTANGITTKGAFLFANSWGKSYGRNGYMWITYDALNSTSEYDDFVLPDGLGEDVTRDWAFDQFCFIYWDSDVTVGMPSLYATVEVSVANRDNFAIELSRTDKNGQTVTFSPSLFAFKDMHINYDIKGYLNPDGVVGGGAVDSYFAVNFEPLFDGFPAGCDYSEYDYSIIIRSYGEDAQLTVRKVTLKNAAGEELRTVDYGGGKAISKGTAEKLTFSFGEKKSPSFLDGKYELVNASTGNYLIKNSFVGMKTGAEKEAVVLEILHDEEMNTYCFSRSSDDFVMDFTDGASDGSAVTFNKQSKKRVEQQCLHISYNDDGTICIFTVNEEGVCYALCEENGGVVVREVNAIEDAMRWKAVSTEKQYGQTFVSSENGKLAVSGTTTVKTDTALVTLLDPSGEKVAEKTVSVTARAFETYFDTPVAGAYMITVTDQEAADNIGYTYVFTIQ